LWPLSSSLDLSQTQSKSTSAEDSRNGDFMSQGKGISDAVRESIRDWITPDVAEKIRSAAKTDYQNFIYQLRDAKSWVRRVRRGIANGWERDYDCKQIPGGRVGLRVHTDSADRYIKYVTFRVDGKLIGGGVVNVPSVLVGQASLMGRRIQNASFAATEATPRFRPFTASELAKLTTELEYGDSGIIDSMFEERA